MYFSASESDLYPTPSFEWARRAHSKVVSFSFTQSKALFKPVQRFWGLQAFIMLSSILLWVAKPLLLGIDPELKSHFLKNRRWTITNMMIFPQWLKYTANVVLLFLKLTLSLLKQRDGRFNFNGCSIGPSGVVSCRCGGVAWSPDMEIG